MDMEVDERRNECLKKRHEAERSEAQPASQQRACLNRQRLPLSLVWSLSALRPFYGVHCIVMYNFERPEEKE